jgi:dTDP-4-dehydrorhamnose 3,5-epimerase
MIEGVVVKELVTHADERGFFREILRVTDDMSLAGFGQLSHSLVHPGVIKAWHGHTLQTQWTYVAAGLLKVVLYDGRSESPTFRQRAEFLVGIDQHEKVYCFPPGVLHGYRCVDGPAHVIYVTSGVYDLSDEIRLPTDDPSIGYDFMSTVPINDLGGIERNGL